VAAKVGKLVRLITSCWRREKEGRVKWGKEKGRREEGVLGV